MPTRDQLSLFGPPGEAPRDEVEPATPPPPRRGRAPRRFLVQVLGDDRQGAAAEAALQDLARTLPNATVVAVDPARELIWHDLAFLAIDTETTGLDPATGRVIEVGWVRMDRGQETAAEARFCRVDEPLDESVSRLTGITDEMLRAEAPFADVAPALIEALASVDFVAAYNAAFDRAFLAREMALLGLELPDVPWIDPLVFIREIDRYKPGKKLSEASRRWGVSLDSPHRALADARATATLLRNVAPYLPSRSLLELLDQQQRWAARQLAPTTELPGPVADDEPPGD